MQIPRVNEKRWRDSGREVVVKGSSNTSVPMELLSSSFWSSTFSMPTPFLGLKLWLVLVLLAAVLSSLLLLLVIPLCLSLRHRRRAPSVPLCKLSPEDPVKLEESCPHYAEVPPPRSEIKVEVGKPEHQVVVADHASNRGGHVQRKAGPEVSHLGWGHWYTLRELEEATGGLAPDNVIGEGGYGIVYKGILPDDTMVAVKNLLNNRGQAEREFKMEVEAIGRVRHKNLVRLLGFCVEGAYRMLVYEYVDNGNLAQWLHGDVGQISPLTWDMRMNIILGTAKGLTYLHEGLEPKVVHRDVKSSNILLDKHWNPKVSDFGLAKLLCSDTNHVTTRVMGTFGYVAPEYASTGMLNEKSDIYSFGVLVMEIISGREPVDYARLPEEVHLVEWLRNMVADRKSFEVLDPKITEKPCPKAMKRALLVALRCVDPDARRRPKMGHVIHMLESDDLLLHDEKKIARGESSSLRDYSKRTLGRQKLNDTEINPNLDRTNWR